MHNYFKLIVNIKSKKIPNLKKKILIFIHYLYNIFSKRLLEYKKKISIYNYIINIKIILNHLFSFDTKESNLFLVFITLLFLLIVRSDVIAGVIFTFSSFFY